MKKLLRRTIITSLFITSTILRVGAQDLKANAAYQRTLSYLLLMASEINGAYQESENQAQFAGTINEKMPELKKLLTAAKESYQLAKPAIKDTSLIRKLDNDIGSMDKLLMEMRNANMEKPTWVLILKVEYMQVRDLIRKQAN